MPKIVIIGAGSGFGSRLSIDILSRDVLQDSTIALCDIHEGRLSQVTDYVERAVQGHDLPARVISSKDRIELLPDADFVVTAVSIGGAAYWGAPYCYEIDIPAKYGIHQQVGDTIGPGGVFRFLRTAHEHLEFAKDIERLCPDALMLNYTNPMAMLTWLHSVGTSVQNVGLCHSVQGTTRKLARAIDLPYDEMSYLVAGINHQAWVLRFRHQGEDMYPRIRQLAKAGKILTDDKVRVEMMNQFGYFITESSRHNSEYVPYFSRTQQLRDAFDLRTRTEPVPMVPRQQRVWQQDTGVTQDEAAPIPPLQRSHEYASAIIEARLTGTPLCFNGSMMNHGSITNLPKRCCVEVPCLVDREGLHPTYVGALPAQCAAINMSNIAVQELSVQAVLDGDREAAFHAVALDPLTAGTLSLAEIRSMFDEMWEAEKDWLGRFED